MDLGAKREAGDRLVGQLPANAGYFLAVLWELLRAQEAFGPLDNPRVLDALLLSNSR